MTDRTRQAWPGSSYVLPCDDDESQRLTRQHMFIAKTCGGSTLLLPEDFISSLKSGYVKVLDIGTGNGVWLFDFHTTISSTAKLVGIDIEGRMYPIEFPPQMNFEVGSALELPSEWSEDFHLVHQRLLLGGLKKHEWPIAISEHFRVLRSGGYVQLLEVDLRNVDAGPNSVQLMHIIRKMFAMSSMDIDQADRLPLLLTDAGFVDVQVHKKEWSLHGKHNILARENLVRATEGLKGPLVKCGLISCDDFDKLMDALETEWESIQGKPLNFFVVTGRKP